MVVEVVSGMTGLGAESVPIYLTFWEANYHWLLRPRLEVRDSFGIQKPMFQTLSCPIAWPVSLSLDFISRIQKRWQFNPVLPLTDIPSCPRANGLSHGVWSYLESRPQAEGVVIKAKAPVEKPSIFSRDEQEITFSSQLHPIGNKFFCTEIAQPAKPR